MISVLTTNLFSQTTLWNESKLKDYWQKNGFKDFEGIYEDVSYPYYKLGLISENGNYKLIFLVMGSTDPDYRKWKEGDVKGSLIPTATKGLYKSIWYLVDKEPTQRYVIQFGKGNMQLLTTSIAGNDIFLKIFPSDSTENATLSEQRIASGTGLGISSNGLIVTNYHVVEGSHQIKVRGINSDFSRSYSAKIILVDRNNDLAVIQVDSNEVKLCDSIPFPIKTSQSAVGENIFVLGYPLLSTMGDELKLTNGIISSRTGFQGDITSYQISAPIQPGNSGGPLFDNQGNLIGIINAKHIGAENASYAIKSVYLSSLIESLPKPPNLQDQNPLAGKSLSQQVEIIRKIVYIIEAK